MNKYIFIAPSIFALALLAGCILPTQACYYPDTPGTLAPDWVCSGSIEGSAITATGHAEKTKSGRAFMQQMAVANARTSLAQKLTGKNAKMIQTASGVAKITVEDLTQSKIIKSIISPAGGLYILVKFEPGK